MVYSKDSSLNFYAVQIDLVLAFFNSISPPQPIKINELINLKLTYITSII